MPPTPRNRSAHTPFGVIGVGSYLPSQRRDNETVATSAGVSAEWILRRTGVHSRHIASPEEAASDLAAAAVKAACAAAGIDLDQLDVIIVATSTPDELGPATACRVQERTGARHAVALDVTAACSGWLFAAKVAHDWLVCTPQARYAAVVGVEAYSKFLDTTDRATASLFADGAAATIFGPTERGGFLDFALGSDGRFADYALIPQGGSRLPNGPGAPSDRRQKISMNGPGVRKFIEDVFPRIVDESLSRNRIALSDLTTIVTHQPNPVLLTNVAHNAGITDAQLVIVGDEVGNIGAGSIPYALATAAGQGRLHEGDLVLAVAFGGGVTWGTALLEWTGASSVRLAPARLPHLQAL
ncbi:3-oxoacyl-[acyl-carrier-protein] synthase 3 [Streptomyces spiroverticillatus]|uniref:3-oxoacyl-[acyl-carrier-protein] synthase 3 n=1 Tax=Streptomyces finlayi TaxID=67296 RepID=A0A918X999_9ACTN|nr:ketoacyl-ACP synthase III [Streptomyces finlayi]GHA49554.1 3-oxoacyl-[acyl-carrier-protein] synthase 3 [Streptomyces spiroverticillatus]GHD19386.1 3-oxoacyl-[acyl-carrier-protein] synthase 3 [Streptomyces finlayi]